MARADLEACMASSVPYSICFHAQQATEKYLKAFLAFHEQEVLRSYNIEYLIECCARIDPLFNSLLTHANSLQSFAVEIRYAASKEEAEQKCPDAWAAMTAVFEVLAQSLPKEIVSIVRLGRTRWGTVELIMGG